jgi:hypothetical protein
MPNLANEIRESISKKYGVEVLKVKQTDDPKKGLALLGGGVGFWVNLDTLEETAPVTIYQEVITVIRPGFLSNPHVAKRDDSAAWMESIQQEIKKPARRKGGRSKTPGKKTRGL